MRFFLIFSLPDRLLFSTISGEIFFRKKVFWGNPPLLYTVIPSFYPLKSLSSFCGWGKVGKVEFYLYIKEI